MRRTLIKSAVIISMDDAIGDFSTGDVLIERNRIVDVRPSIDVGSDTEIVEAEGRIVIPGLINAHMHTWQTALRGYAANWTLLEYFRRMHAGLATVFRPEDIYIATLVGALNQINQGATTLVDWCHNNPTPDHTDAAVRGLIESGIRAAFFHGSPKPEPKPGERHFSEVPHPRREVERLLAGPLADRDGLVTLGLAILGPHYSTLDVAMHDFRMARELNLIASMHQGGGPAKTPDGWEKLTEAGLVGAGINIVHGNDLPDDLLDRMVDLGVSFSVTPENEMIQGHGFPITGRLLKRGVRPTIGIDLESVLAGDLFSAARVALSTQRSLDNAESRKASGTIPATTTIPVREALRWITTEGARMLGRENQIGSLTPGKLADLVIINASDLNLVPVHDPVAAVVMQTSLANIEAVMIAAACGRSGMGGCWPTVWRRKSNCSCNPAGGWCTTSNDRDTPPEGVKDNNNDRRAREHRFYRDRQDGPADVGARRQGRLRRDRVRPERRTAQRGARARHLDCRFTGRGRARQGRDRHVAAGRHGVARRDARPDRPHRRNGAGSRIDRDQHRERRSLHGSCNRRAGARRCLSAGAGLGQRQHRSHRRAELLRLWSE
ncbi:cytosine/adenosine deaminase-related metal-dependent hydrolase [Bradyrhizobium sp. LM3.2]